MGDNYSGLPKPDFTSGYNNSAPGAVPASVPARDLNPDPTGNYSGLPTPTFVTGYNRQSGRNIPGSMPDQEDLAERNGSAAIDDDVDAMRAGSIRQQGSSGAAGVDDVATQRSGAQSGGIRRAGPGMGL